MEGDRNKSTELICVAADGDKDKNSDTKRCCNASVDHCLVDDDCVVTLDQDVDLGNPSKSEQDVTSRDSLTSLEISELGLKIQDVVSLSSPANARNNTVYEIDADADFGNCVERHSSSDTGLSRSNNHSDRSVVRFLEETYGCSVDSKQGSKGRKNTEWNLNGSCRKFQPIIALVDVMKTPMLPLAKGGGLTDGGKLKRKQDREEDDCIVIDNDLKSSDVIVVDDVQEPECSLESPAFHKSTCSVTDNDPLLLSPSHSSHLDRLGFPGIQEDLHCGLTSSSLKRPMLWSEEEGSSRKMPRTDCPDDLLILDCTTPENLQEKICQDDFHVDRKIEQPQFPSKSLDSSCQSVCPSAGSVGKYSLASKSSDGKNLNDHTGGIKATDVGSLGSAVGQSLDNSGDSCSIVLDRLPKQPPQLSKSANDSNLPSPTKVQASHLLDPEGAVTGSLGKGKDSDDTLATEVSSDVAFNSLVGYDLSDSDDSLADKQSPNAAGSCSEVTIVRRHHPHSSGILSTTSTTSSATSGVSITSQSAACSTSKTLGVKSFYSSQASSADIFPKQYKPRLGLRSTGNARSGAKLGFNQSLQEDVVHISSDEDEILGISVSGDVNSSFWWNSRTNQNQTLKEKSQTSMKPGREPVQSFTSPGKRSKRRSSTESSLTPMITPIKIIYRSKTCIPRECHLTPTELNVVLNKVSYSFDVRQFVPFKEVKDGRIMFQIPSEAADELSSMLDLPLVQSSGCSNTNDCLTICIDEATPMNTLMALLEQMSETAETNDLPEELTMQDEYPAFQPEQPSWRLSALRFFRRCIPRKKASWSQPRHWNKRRFFSRYNPPKRMTNQYHSAPFNTVADDAFLEMNPYDTSCDMQPPIQVSGFSGTTIKLFTYPPPPAARGIEVNNQDLFCLNAGEYVNDVIIDFYLKYLFNEVLSEEDRVRTHVFSSFFYGHLVSGSPKDNSANLSIAEQRHQKVRTWTRHVNLFSKDFIIVPINENYHWFLAIICFPGLNKPIVVAESPSMVPRQVQQRANDSSVSGEEKLEKPTSVVVSPEGSVGTPDNSNQQLTSDSESMLDSKSTEVIKNPCILIFDSLQGDLRWDVACTLRQYLQIEWDKKKASTEGSRSFSKDLMKGCRPSCPQQPNYSDCGLYLLQYVEAFFKKPLRNFTLPIKYLRNWFDGSEALAKRSQLRTLILELKDKLNPDLVYDPIADGCCNDDITVDDLSAT